MNNARAAAAERLVSRLVRHGASAVSIAELVARGQIIWSIGPHQDVSDACLAAEEFMASATRNCRRANDLIGRMSGGAGRRDEDMMTALKKYVEDTCMAIKEVDNELKRNGSSLDALLFEIPGKSDDQMSWRGLIARRDVIAHQLLTVDDERVYHEAERDFGLLEQLISRVYFVPIKTDLGADRNVQPLMRTDALKGLAPVTAGESPRIGNSIVFVFEDAVDGFEWIRMGRTEDNTIALFPSRPMHFLFANVEGMKSVTDDLGLREAVRTARKNQKGVTINPGQKIACSSPVDSLTSNASDDQSRVGTATSSEALRSG